MKEKWKLVADGYYAVSNFGHVKRMKPGRGTYVGKPVGNDRPGKYTAVDLRGRLVYVHELVAENFIGPKPKGKEVNHKDTIKTNNRWDNLEYKTHQENQMHAFLKGVLPLPNVKLTVDKVRKIRREARLDAIGRISNVRVLAKRYRVCRDTIWLVVTKRSWTKIEKEIGPWAT